MKQSEYSRTLRYMEHLRLEAMEADTGFHWTPGKTVLDRMVDDATGVPVEFLKAFAKWHNENISSGKRQPTKEKIMDLITQLRKRRQSA